MYRIATLNLQNFACPPYAWYDWEAIYSAEQWQMKTQWLQRLWQQAHTDVLALQEVFSVEALQRLCAQAGLDYLLSAGQPTMVDQHIFTAPVVALASRYPLTELTLPSVDQAWLTQLQLSGFKDSREPLLARLQLPGIGDIDICVVHLKSRRPDKQLSGPLARVKSEQQRLLEAAILWQRLALHHAQAARPLLLCGDFNDELSSPLLQPLLALDASLRLQDAAHLVDGSIRPPTHYYGAHGKVLDYLLCSQEFDPRYHHAVAEVVGYQVFDEHLVRPQYALHGHSSDHALVQLIVQPRR
ncbi:MAG TPA: endonuclease [Rheinheimera sp.]|nr:endonuclease [Rheinheimera sp.]